MSQSVKHRLQHSALLYIPVYSIIFCVVYKIHVCTIPAMLLFILCILSSSVI